MESNTHSIRQPAGLDRLTAVVEELAAKGSPHNKVAPCSGTRS